MNRPTKPTPLGDGTFSVPLTRGKCAIIDERDVELIGQYNWYAGLSSHKRRSYARTQILNENGQRTIYMHRLILGIAGGLVVDHINHDGLDNRRENLRSCTTTQNRQNCPKFRAGCTSIYKGVNKVERKSKWRSGIWISGKTVCLGSFRTAIEAALAYDAAALEHFGEFACLNFPNTGSA